MQGVYTAATYGAWVDDGFVFDPGGGTGCVQRKMTIEWNPPGALVYLNDQEIGRTPITTDFIWYGNYQVEVRKDGFETLKTHQQVNAPWWQLVPIDLFAEFFPV